MRWDFQDVSDDHGQGRRRDLVHVAKDDTGRQWFVSQHDDKSWQWMWWNPSTEEPIAMGEGFKTDAEALAAAERYAAEVLA